MVPTSRTACAGEVTPRACPVLASWRRLSPLQLLHIGPDPTTSMMWVPTGPLERGWYLVSGSTSGP